MNKAKSWLCVPLIPMFTACVHNAPCSEKVKAAPPSEGPIAIAVPSEAPSELAVVQKVNEKIGPVSAGVYLRVEMDPKVYSGEGVRALTEGIKTTLNKKKFEVRAASPGAHSQLTVTSFEDSATDTRGVALVWGVRHSGQRPQRWIQQSFTVHAPIETVWPKLSAKILENFEALELAPPSGPPKVSADPSCAPRFGFESDERNVVTVVLPKSPAQRAGLRVGDVILAIDSRRPTWDRPDVTEDVYLQRISVPLKLERQGVVVRSQLRAENLCE